MGPWPWNFWYFRPSAVNLWSFSKFHLHLWRLTWLVTQWHHFLIAGNPKNGWLDKISYAGCVFWLQTWNQDSFTQMTYQGWPIQELPKNSHRTARLWTSLWNGCFIVLVRRNLWYWTRRSCLILKNPDPASHVWYYGLKCNRVLDRHIRKNKSTAGDRKNLFKCRNKISRNKRKGIKVFE